jgi:hypothetical protein
MFYSGNPADKMPMAIKMVLAVLDATAKFALSKEILGTRLGYSVMVALQILILSV